MPRFNPPGGRANIAQRAVPWSLLCCVVLAPACTLERRQPASSRTGAPAAADSAAVAEIRAELERYYADLSARDWPAFASHFWPGAALTTVWQPPGDPGPRVVATTVPEFVRQAPAGPGSQPIFEERMLSLEVRTARNLAQAWARYEVRFGRREALRTWRGIDAFTLLRHDGRWKITALAYTDE